ncbi:MAG TPA: hypothetical protein GX701_06820 [Clostridiales bacterium]|jgi:hypothetical protein|nr:hypothetical protein [Clostridiales bacterium]
MEREFIGKDVEVLVSFAGSFRDAGYAPVKFHGKLLDTDENYLKMQVNKAELAITGILGSMGLKNSGLMLIKRDYVIYMRDAR